MSAVSRLGFIFELADAGRKLGFTCRGAIVLGSATCLLGCMDEDRVLTARCQVTSDGFAAATFSPSDLSEATIGGLNARQEALGTLFRFAPDQEQIGRARWTPTYTLTQAINVSYEVYWNSLSLRAHVKIDLDGEELTESSRTSIESTLLSGSAVVAWNVERQAITDVLRTINEDSKALSILQRATPQDRYLVISSRLLAKNVGLFYTPGGGKWLPDGRGSVSTPFVTPWTFRIGNTNYHSVYSCDPVDELNSKAALMKARVPDVYFYTAVRYDSATKRAERDLRLTDLDLLTATSRAAQTQ